MQPAVQQAVRHCILASWQLCAGGLWPDRVSRISLVLTPRTAATQSCEKDWVVGPRVGFDNTEMFHE